MRLLVLSRKPGQRILIGENIALVVLEVRPDGVKLGIEAPRSVSIYREELLQEIRHLNRQAAHPGTIPAQMPAKISGFVGESVNSALSASLPVG